MQMLIPGRGFEHGCIKRLNNDEILSFPTSDAIILFPAPGINRLIIPFILTASANIEVAPYIGADTGDDYIAFKVGSQEVAFIYNDDSAALQLHDLLGGTFNITMVLPIGARLVPSNGTIGAAPLFWVNAVNQPLTVVLNTDAGIDLTGGDPNNSLLFSVLFGIFNIITGQFE